MKMGYTHLCDQGYSWQIYTAFTVSRCSCYHMAIRVSEIELCILLDSDSSAVPLKTEEDGSGSAAAKPAKSAAKAV